MDENRKQKNAGSLSELEVIDNNKRNRLIQKKKLLETNQAQNINKIWNDTLTLKNLSMEKTEHCVVLFLLCFQKEFVITEKDIQNLEPGTAIREACKDGEGESAALFSAAYDVFEPVLDKIPKDTLYDLIRYFSVITPEIGQDEFGEVFDAVLYRLARFYGTGFGDSFLPPDVTKFLCQLADIAPGARVYNPFAGFASFGIFLKDYKEYVAEEIKAVIHQTGLLRLWVHGKLHQTSFKQTDSIESLKPVDLFNQQDDGYDLIIANPPYGMRLFKESRKNYGLGREVTDFFIEQALARLKPGGKLIALVTPGFLFQPRMKEIRKRLTDQNLLEAVIALPSGLLYHTGIANTVLVISKHKEKSRTVTFADASQFVEESFDKKKNKLFQYDDLITHLKNNTKSDHLIAVDRSNIAQYDYNLNPLIYLGAHDAGDDDKTDMVSLREVIEPIQTSSNFDRKKGIVIFPGNLNEDGEIYLNIDSIVPVELKRPLREVSENCLFISFAGKSLRPTYFHYKNTPVYIPNNIRAFRLINNNIDLSYLIYTLNTPGFRNRIRTGTSNLQHVLSIKEFLNFYIKLPPIEMQGAKVDGIREMEVKLQQVIQERDLLQATISDKYSQIFSSLKHSMGNYMTDIISSIVLLKDTLESNNINSRKILVCNNVNLEEHIYSLQNQLRMVSGLLENVKEDFDRNHAGFERIDFLAFFKELEIECKTRLDQHISIQTLIDPDLEQNQEKTPYILGNRALLHSALKNIVDNALKHAFTGLRKNYKLLLNLDIQASQDLPRTVAHFFEENDVILKIEIANNGEPFPEGFTREHLTRLRLKAGKTGNQGIGGFDIDDIVRRHNGYFDLILTDPDEGEFVTTYCIYLPLA